jgi:hypothetical protein
MRKKTFFVVLLAAALLSIALVPQLFAKEANPANPLSGAWKITHRPVNDAGVPCPFLPEAMNFLGDGSLEMSNIPGMHMPYKTKLTADEKKALEKRSEEYKGKSVLLVKPNPKMEWLNTPMVYIYSVAGDVLSLTPQGWETATFQRVK